MAFAGRAQPVVIHGYPCSVGQLLSTLEGDELEAFEAMLGTPERRGWSAPAIWRAANDEGYEVGLQTINRHRGRKCRCYPDAS